jgi:hypothetical protein
VFPTSLNTNLLEFFIEELVNNVQQLDLNQRGAVRRDWDWGWAGGAGSKMDGGAGFQVS